LHGTLSRWLTPVRAEKLRRGGGGGGGGGSGGAALSPPFSVSPPPVPSSCSSRPFEPDERRMKYSFNYD